jgi:hypothetical protein
VNPGALFAAEFPPAVGDVIRKAIRKVETGRITGCVHLEDEPVGVICWQHPTMVRCQACASAHVKGHSVADEHGCDLCGEHMPTAASSLLALFQPVEVDALVPIGRGRVAAVGQVIVTGWGACVECFGHHNSGGAR